MMLMNIDMEVILNNLLKMNFINKFLLRDKNDLHRSHCEPLAYVEH